MKNIIVKESTIQGRGVFASRDIKKGEVVLRWDTSHALPSAKNLSEKELKYISFIYGKIIVMQEPEKYVNHSCSPNTTTKNFCDVAIKDIKKGEEITQDYKETMLPETKTDFKCNCEKCKKV